MPISRVYLLSFILIGLFSNLVNAQTTNELISLADQAQSQREYRTALIYLKNAAKQDPQNISVRLKMIHLFVETGQGVQAEVELDKAKRLGAKSAEIAVLAAKAKFLQGQFGELTENINLLDLPQTEIARLRAIQGHAFYEQRKFQQAKQMFQRALLLSPNEVEVELGQAKLFELNDNKQQEYRLIQSLLERYPYNPEVLIVAGRYYRNSGDYDKALELFNLAGEIQPSNVNIWFGVVRSYIAKRDFNDAKMEIQKVLVNYPEHQVGNYLLSVIAYEEGDFARAKSAIDIVLKGEKRKYEALKLLSIIQFQLQEYTEAEKNLKIYLKLHAKDMHGLKILAAIYLKRNQGTLALNVLKKLEPLDDAYIYSMIATAFLQTGNSEKADLYMQKSLAAAPEDKVIQRHFQRSQLMAGKSFDLEFSDTDYNNFLSEGHIAILNLLRKKQYSKAIEIIQGYMQHTADNSIYHYLLGSTYMYQQDTDNALKEFQKSLKLNPELIESRINLAKVYQLKGDSRDAERELREVLKYQKNNDQALVALAGIYHRAKNDEEMLKFLNRSRRANSASLASREVLEDYYRKQGDRKKALEISQEMVNIQPQNIKLLLKLANNQKALNRLDRAIKTFKKIVEVKPELASAWSGLGRLQFLDHKYEQAEKSYLKVLDLEPDNLIAKVILIQIDIKTDRLKAALAKAKKLSQQHPHSPAGFDMLGDVHIALNQPDKAIVNYEQSLKRKYSSETYIKLHSAYNRNNQLEKGFTLLQQWVKKYPEDYTLKEVLALTYQRRGELQKSSDLYQEIVKKHNNNDRVLNNLALVSLGLNSPMSIEYAEMAFNLNPENHKNTDTLGWVLLKNNNLNKALKLLKEATESSPGDSNFRYHYAAALSKAGNIPLAKKQLFLALGKDKKFSERKAAQKLLNQLTKK